MKIVVAPDSFKESLRATAAAAAMAKGIRRAAPEAEIIELPLTDGGQGAVDALVTGTGGRFESATVAGPLGAPVVATWGWLGDSSDHSDESAASRTAVIEMATAAGLELVPLGSRDPRVTTTFGVGALIRRAVGEGASRIILCIGGSATNDGGAGMAQALGYRLLDDAGRDLPPGAAALASLRRIVPPVRRDWEGVEIQVACDVKSPLLGPTGASAIFGPQKGATPAMVAELDAALANLADRWKSDLGVDVADLPGGGAAGGLGAGLVAFTAATLTPGIDLVLTTLRAAEHLAGADLCFTGEGRLDGQSCLGKTVGGLAGLCQSQNVPVIAIAGSLGDDARSVLDQGVSAFFSLMPRPATLPEAMANTALWLADAAEQATRLFLAAKCGG